MRFSRQYISHGLRGSAQEIATEELGPRHDDDVRRVYAKEITHERFTSLDREIERRTKEEQIDVRADRRDRIEPSLLVARLKYLESMRLAEKTGPGSWTLSEGWRDDLRELGARGDIIKQMHKAIAGDPSRYRVIQPGVAVDGEDGERIITGRVAGKGLLNELKGTFYAVIETPSGRAYHVPIDARAAEKIRTGAVVSFVTRPDQKDPSRHRLSLRDHALSLDAQVNHRGPVWLDRVAEKPLAPYGFGADLQHAVRKRRDALRAMGIAPDDPDRSRKLREIGRQQTGKAITGRGRQR